MLSMTIGKVYITGKWPQEIDGLFLGYSDTKTKVFTWHLEGLARRGKLYKTQDPAYLAECLGVADYKYKSVVTYQDF